jgi:hypothetical protein
MFEYAIEVLNQKILFLEDGNKYINNRNPNDIECIDQINSNSKHITELEKAIQVLKEHK